MSTTHSELARRIAAIAPVAFTGTPEPVHGDDKASTGEVDGVACHVTDTTFSQVAAFDDMVAYDPNADALWPGAVVQGRALRDGLLAPIGVARAPLVITVTTPLGLKKSSVTVDAPSLASVTKAVGHLLAPVDAATPARLSFVCRSAASLEQGLLHVGCDIRWLGGSAAADVSGRLSSSSSLVVVRLMQAYYTVACEPPVAPAALFAREVTADDVAPYMGEGNPPAYVASVTFGRTLLFVIQSSATSTDLQAAVNAAFNSGASEGGVEVDASYRKVLTASQMQVLAVGGSSQHAAAVITGEGLPEAIHRYVREGATFSRASPGVPISFQCRHLRDNTHAGMVLSTSWVERRVAGINAAIDDLKVGPLSGVVDTGIVVRKGDRIVLTATGSVWSGVWATGANDANGWVQWAQPSQGGFPMMDTHPFALIGTIDDRWFFVGPSKEWVHDGATGRLKLSINTNNHTVGNGELAVRLSVIRRVEAA